MSLRSSVFCIASFCSEDCISTSCCSFVASCVMFMLIGFAPLVSAIVVREEKSVDVFLALVELRVPPMLRDLSPNLPKRAGGCPPRPGLVYFTIPARNFGISMVI